MQALISNLSVAVHTCYPNFLITNELATSKKVSENIQIMLSNNNIVKTIEWTHMLNKQRTL